MQKLFWLDAINLRRRFIACGDFLPREGHTVLGGGRYGAKKQKTDLAAPGDGGGTGTAHPGGGLSRAGYGPGPG